MRVAIVSLALALIGCGDDEHKGSVSHGPTVSPTASDAPQKKVRLVYQPKSPVVTMRLAEIARKRVKGAEIKLGGETVHIDVAADRAEEAKAAMAGGRLDLWLASHEGLEPGSSGFTAATETIPTPQGPKTRRYLLAPPEQRSALIAHAEAQAGKAKALVGPKEEMVRTHLVVADKSVRGEHVASARAESHPEGALLRITFEGTGRNFIRWNSKQREQFVLEIDGAVAGTAHPNAEVSDGAIAFVLRGWSTEAAEKLAASIDGIAISHRTELEREGPL